MTGDSTLSFDRMRGMLLRAAEIRDSEQQQIFDSLDEIHARLAALDTLGSVRKRLGELPDRTEVGVLAERLDEAVAKLDAQDAALAALTRAVEALPDKLGRPIASLDGRLDGVAGRLEGVSGRMDGLDDRLGGLHKRLDDLDNRIDRNDVRLDGLPGALGAPVRERIDGLERAVREQLAAGDPATALEALTTRLDALTARLDALDAAVAQRPDSAAVGELVARANEVSERRSAGQLDEAMATFAEIIVGRGASMTGSTPRPPGKPPRGPPQQDLQPLRQRRGRRRPAPTRPRHPDPTPHPRVVGFGCASRRSSGRESSIFVCAGFHGTRRLARGKPTTRAAKTDDSRGQGRRVSSTRGGRAGAGSSVTTSPPSRAARAAATASGVSVCSSASG